MPYRIVILMEHSYAGDKDDDFTPDPEYRMNVFQGLEKWKATKFFRAIVSWANGLREVLQ